MKLRYLLMAIGLMCFTAPAHAQGPTLVPAALQGVSPAGVERGRTVTFFLNGINIQGATRAVFDDPAITGTVAPGDNRNQAKVTATIGPDAQVGIRRVYLHTPLGTTGSVTFAVGAWPEVQEKEPNDALTGPTVSLPATLLGNVDKSGDLDHFRFQAEAGQELVFEVVAAPIRSRLTSVLTLLDGSGKVLAESQGVERQLDALLTYRFAEAGTYTLRVRDFENTGGGGVNYRINAGPFAHATGAFPLGLRKGEGEVTLHGMNLGEGQRVRVAADASGWGATTALRAAGDRPLLYPVRLAVGEEPEVMEADLANERPDMAQRVELPVTINGRISGRNGDQDYYRFRATKGQSFVLEVNARRLGSPLDSVIEVLDSKGQRVERATVRPVAEALMTFNDRDSATSGLRLLTWNDLAINDYVYVRGEILQILRLPLGPDEDVRFRSHRGQRTTFLDTTSTGHAVNTSVYKVQIHPPGRTFPPNGMPLFRLYYQNDDGGPLYGKDSRLTFTAPADGEYVVRIADVRGEESDRHAYRLTVREPRPEFRLTLSPEHPNVPVGSSVPVEVMVDRLDGLDGPIDVRLEGLPAGITATPGVVEAGEATATLMLTAAPDARTAEPAGLRLVGSARTPAGEIVRSLSPAGSKAVVTVLPKPDLTVRTAQAKLTILPGTEQYVEATITRDNGFAGRVPIDLKNLPHGVRVLDVGLNGVLITETERSRRFTIICEPWVKPQQRLVYCTVRTETESPASTEVAAEPILLEILPKPARTAGAGNK